MKYIDADKLKAEIERLEVLYDEALKNPSFASYESSLIAKGKHRQREDLLSFIDSLQQDQPEREGLVSMEGLTDREILHKMLDKILDTNGAENYAIWTQFFLGFIGERAKQVTYRLRIDTEKTVTFTDLWPSE